MGTHDVLYDAQDEIGGWEKGPSEMFKVLQALLPEYHDHVLGPNLSPGASLLRGVNCASAVFFHTELPHQLTSMPPFGRICREKNMTNMPMITPASSPAARG